MGSAYYLFTTRPTSFLPTEDQGVFFINVQLPESSTLSRTNKVLARVSELLKKTPGVADVIAVAGYSLLSGSSENVGLGFRDPRSMGQTGNAGTEAGRDSGPRAT